MRSPFLTRCSEGKPLRRLLLRSKAEVAGGHDTLLVGPVAGRGIVAEGADSILQAAAVGPLLPLVSDATGNECRVACLMRRCFSSSLDKPHPRPIEAAFGVPMHPDD